MGLYLTQRLCATVLVMVIVATTIFVLLRWLPGDPVSLAYPEVSDPAMLARVRTELGFDRALYVQYFDWIGQLARGDLGRSLRTRETVLESLAQRLPVTIELAVVSLLLSLLLALPVGTISATRPGSRSDLAATLVGLAGISAPQFFVAILLIYVFAVFLRWLPPSGFVDPLKDPLPGIKSLILPGISLGASMAGVTMRTLRSSLLEVLSQDYVSVARAKGLRESTVVRRHAIKNALIPVVTVVGLQVGTLLGGTVVIETVFAYPGVGRLLVDSLLAKDYFMVQGVVLILALGFCLINLSVDLLYSVVDPRIRYR